IGKDVFPDATKAVVNLGIAMAEGDAANADFHASAIQVGKALNDPIKGLTALRKVGVSFTADQEKQIKALVKAGKVEEAQKVILGELATEFGKAGQAAGTSGAAGARRLNDAVEDLQQNLAQGLDPALTRIRDKLGVVLKDPKVQKAVRDLGTFLGDAAEQGVKFAEDIPWDKVASALKTAAGFAGNLIKAFTNLPPEVQGTIIALAGLNKLSGGAVSGIVSELGKGLIKGVLGMTAGVVNLKAATVIGGGGLPGAAAPAVGAAPAAAAGGLTAGAVATTAAVGVILVGGAAVSLNAIADEAGKNNQLAAQGLTQQEIVAQKFYNANKADQDRIFKQLHGAIPPVSVFESGNAKLGQVLDAQSRIAANIADGGKLQNVANERLEAIRGFASTSAAAADKAKKDQIAAIQQASADQVHTTERHEQNIADKITELNAQARTAAQLAAGDSRSEQAAVARAANQTAAATVTAGGKAAAAGNVVATAVRNKDLSVTVNNRLTVSTRVSVSNDLNAKNNFKSVYNVAF